MNKKNYIDYECDLAELKINRIIARYKTNTEFWENLGMIAPNDANEAVDKILTRIKEFIKIIENNYAETISSKDDKKIKQFLEKIRKRTIKELSPSLIMFSPGTYTDRMGISHEANTEEMAENFKQKLNDFSSLIGILEARSENFVLRSVWSRRFRKISIFVPIILSIASLIVSIIALYVGGSK